MGTVNLPEKAESSGARRPAYDGIGLFMAGRPTRSLHCARRNRNRPRPRRLNALVLTVADAPMLGRTHAKHVDIPLDAWQGFALVAQTAKTTCDRHSLTRRLTP